MSEHTCTLSSRNGPRPSAPETPRRWRPSSPTTSAGVGPLGFILPRPAWLDRHRQGLAYEQFSLEEIQIRLYDEVAVVTARNNARGTYQGQPLPEALRATLVIASNSKQVRLAAVHMSFIAGTQGSPPMPGPTDSAEKFCRHERRQEGTMTELDGRIALVTGSSRGIGAPSPSSSPSEAPPSSSMVATPMR